MAQRVPPAELSRALQGQAAAVLFHASWCPLCVSFKPNFDDVASRARGYAPLEVLLDDESDPLWTSLGISAVPTVILFKDARPQRRADARLGVGLTREQLVETFRAAGALP